jgi:hypothetical protein
LRQPSASNATADSTNASGASFATDDDHDDEASNS